MRMSYVTLDRICREEARTSPATGRVLARSGRPTRSSAEQLTDEDLLAKLRDFGVDLDREGMARLCEGALSAEEVARPLLDTSQRRDDIQVDWIWICIVTLWQRWWPDRMSLELLDDKVQAGYGESEVTAQAAIWLDAWSDVLRLCDATDIRSIAEFDDRFPMTQSLYNWSQDLEDALWNAGLRDRELIQARIDLCEEALRRFPREEQLITENRRRALAESYFEADLTGKAEELYEDWLDSDPRWGWGWIGWADYHTAGWRKSRDYERAEELLRHGYAVPGVRDRDSIASRLRDLCEETGRADEAREFAKLVSQSERNAPSVSASHMGELADDGPGPTVVRQTTRLDFGAEGLPLNQFDDAMRMLRAQSSGSPRSGAPARAAEVGRNAPCPCGSTKKFKKCCGSPLARS